MLDWTEEQQMVRDAVRQFVEAEVATRREELEFGDTPPYEVLRKLYKTFGMDTMAADRFKRQIEFEKLVEEAVAKGETPPEKPKSGGGGDGSITMIPIIELCRYSPGPGHRARRVHRPHRRGHHLEGHHPPEGALGARPAHARQDRRMGDHRARTRVPTRSGR